MCVLHETFYQNIIITDEKSYGSLLTDIATEEVEVHLMKTARTQGIIRSNKFVIP